VDQFAELPTEDRDAPSGTQSLERAVAILRAVAATPGDGARLADLVATTGLSKGTVRRLLATLVREGLLDQDGGSRRYRPGLELYALGLSAAPRFGLPRLAVESVQRLAALSHDTVFLQVPSGMEALCIQREEGSFPIRTQVMAAGDRFPLGIGAGSCALLAAHDDPEVERIVAANAPLVAQRYPRFTADFIRGLVAQARRDGYAFNDGQVVRDMCAIGVAVRNRRGEPVGALSISAISPRMAPERRPELAAWLWAERDALEARLGA